MNLTNKDNNNSPPLNKNTHQKNNNKESIYKNMINSKEIKEFQPTSIKISTPNAHKTKKVDINKKY